MSKPLPSLTTFSGNAPPWSLAALDSNFSTVSGALDDLGTFSNFLTDTSGTANQITVAPASGLTVSVTAGLLLQIKVANTTTATAVTLNVNATGNKNVVLPNGQNPPVGLLRSGGVYAFLFDGTNFQLTGAVLPIVADGSGNITVGANLTVGGNLTVSGNLTVTGSCTATGGFNT